MENQHRKISGYRELSQEEIDLMNRIKSQGRELMVLCDELKGALEKQQREKMHNATSNTDDNAEFERFVDAEPIRWADIGKTDIQTGIMALVRAVAQPVGV
ncbi:hypothetical protein GCM10022421_32340 [Oceanisphaera sediminis]|uniref:Acb2/Tad1 hairpin domain-containing protein n=1 Tax=Oceanisphaera sediminis TaxID=981381 RepID=A0ABP7EPB7_9GAMM